MKKLLVVAIVAAVGYVAYAKFYKSERRTCARMTQLCGEKSDGIDKCEADLNDMRQSLGDEAVKKLDTCVADAKSCPEAVGCMVGAAGSGIGDAMNKFMQGVGKGLSK